MELSNDKLQELGTIVPVLCEQNLVSEIERRKIASAIEPADKKAAIYDLLKSKRLNVAIKILKIIRKLSYLSIHGSECSFSEDSDDSVEVQNVLILTESARPVRFAETNPLLNTTIVNNIFEFLTLEDLKTCRIVCEKWNSVAEILFRKRAKIDFRKVSPTVFVRTFEGSSLVPFTAFTFRGQCNLMDLRMFFDSWGANVKSLELESLIVINEDREILVDLDISNWIAQSNITNLSISCSNKTYTQVAVSLNKLNSIKTIQLKGCTVNLQPGIKIYPVEIQINSVNFATDGILLPELRINSIFDFSKTTLIDIHHNARKEATLPILEVDCDIVNAKTVKISGVEIDWGVCKWTVDSLALSSSSFVQTTPLNVKQITFHEFTEIDLGVLPPTLEKLYFAFHMKIFCSLPIILPNLHSLYLHTMRNSSVLSYFTTCVNLVNISIHGHNSRSSADLELTLDSIPTSVKKIKLGGDTIKIVGNGRLQVDSLILEGYSSEDAEEIVEKIKPELLAIEWVQKYDKIDSISMFVLDNQHNIERIVVGSWEFKSRVFKRSRLSNYVDKKSNYYVFQNNFGKALNRKAFDHFMEI